MTQVTQVAEVPTQGGVLTHGRVGQVDGAWEDGVGGAGQLLGWAGQVQGGRGEPLKGRLRGGGREDEEER